MHQVLVYADSLSWGIVPNTRTRFRFDQRWPGIMELELRKAGHSVRVIEDCLNGRRTAWEDPIKPGRNGLLGVEQRIEVNSPLSLVVLFLGTNDFQSMHQNDARRSAEGLRAIVAAIRQTPLEPGMAIPQILVIAPPPIQKAKGSIAPKFAGAEKKAVGLCAAIETMVEEQGCHFFDAGSVTSTSKVDGVHLDEDQHLVLGQAIATKVGSLLSCNLHITS